MYSAALSLLNSLDANAITRLNRVASDDTQTSLGATAQLFTELAEEQHQLAMVVRSLVAAQENRQVAEGNFVDHVV
jgi:hypothetical protein